MNIKPSLSNSFKEQAQKLTPEKVAVIGIPFDGNSTVMRGPALAPMRIREAFNAPSSNTSSENSRDLSKEPRFVDLGDIPVNDYVADIFSPVSLLVNQGARVLSLGGDHSITYPILKGFAQKYKKLNLLQFDAHPDLYDQYEGNRFCHACPFARIMEEGLVGRLVQVGIRTLNPHLQEQAARFNVEVVDMKQWHPSYKPEFDGPVYLSLDLDVLDPAFACGVSHPEPGGLTTREVIRMIQNIKAPLVGADIVELNPLRDSMGITALTAAKFFKEIADKMLAK